jgi:hypothetical protein
MQVLRKLRHENIVSYRGMEYTVSLFLCQYICPYLGLGLTIIVNENIVSYRGMDYKVSLPLSIYMPVFVNIFARIWV